MNLTSEQRQNMKPCRVEEESLNSLLNETFLLEALEDKADKEGLSFEFKAPYFFVRLSQKRKLRYYISPGKRISKYLYLLDARNLHLLSQYGNRYYKYSREQLIFTSTGCEVITENPEENFLTITFLEN